MTPRRNKTPEDNPRESRIESTMGPLPRLAFVLAALASPACRTIDRDLATPDSAARPPAFSGQVAETAKAATADLPSGHSAFVLLKGAREALDWRLALVDHATRSIDLQYYLWNRDASGLLLLSRLLDAADRGVRVRLLLDDILLIDEFFFEDTEDQLAALCHHENVEIRIFNPQFVRSGGPAASLETLARFGELNRRMHNKAFVVDNRLAVLGGRNIGDDYFGLDRKFNFLDLDVLAAGPVVAEASKSFDRYWNCPLSHPGEAFSPKTGPAALPAAAGEIRRFVREDRTLPSSPIPVRRIDWSGTYGALAGRWHSGPAVFLEDAPTPAEERRLDHRFVDRVLDGIGSTSRAELLIASPYLIPGPEIHRVLRGHVDRGLEVRLLTASLEANNHPAIHSHYRQQRRRLLGEGVALHEFRADPGDAVRSLADLSNGKDGRICFHAKAAVGDRARCFIGTLNLDPRAMELNTENGILIESPGLAAELADHLETLMASENSWSLTMEPRQGLRDGLRWSSRGLTLHRQPAPDGKSRILDFLLGLLPIEDLL